MVESEGRAPTILHSFQHPSAVQNKLKILADTDGWVSARNGSAQPGNEGIMPWGMAATTGKHFRFNPTTSLNPATLPYFFWSDYLQTYREGE